MKVIIYSAPTVNGLIAPKDEKDYGFITDRAWELYLKNLKKAGVYVMGRRTYEVSLKTGAFPYPCHNVVMTSQKFKNKWGEKVSFTDFTPKKLVKNLKNKGYKQIVVTGGLLSASFMKEKLVDELWLHLMPTVFTKGTNVFEGVELQANLKLLKAEKWPTGEVLLKYAVVNN